MKRGALLVACLHPGPAQDMNNVNTVHVIAILATMVVSKSYMLSGGASMACTGHKVSQIMAPPQSW
eukprot:scaffold289950_cov19-Tisochrysis_lutea.AAC.2